MKAALDTSSKTASLAVADDQGNTIVHLTDIPIGRASAGLTGKIVAALGAAEISVAAISHWHVGMGPGSFTGIRVGASLVMGICMGTSATPLGIPSSLGLVRGAAKSDDTAIAALHDGRRGEVLLSRYGRRENAWELMEDPQPVAVSSLGEADEKYVILANDDVLPQLSAAARDHTCVLDHYDATWLLPDWAHADADLEPIYVRPAVFVNPAPVKKAT